MGKHTGRGLGWLNTNTSKTGCQFRSARIGNNSQPVLVVHERKQQNLPSRSYFWQRKPSYPVGEIKRSPPGAVAPDVSNCIFVSSPAAAGSHNWLHHLLLSKGSTMVHNPRRHSNSNFCTTHIKRSILRNTFWMLKYRNIVGLSVERMSSQTFSHQTGASDPGEFILTVCCRKRWIHAHLKITIIADNRLHIALKTHNFYSIQL